MDVDWVYKPTNITGGHHLVNASMNNCFIKKQPNDSQQISRTMISANLLIWYLSEGLGIYTIMFQHSYIYWYRW